MPLNILFFSSHLTSSSCSSCVCREMCFAHCPHTKIQLKRVRFDRWEQDKLLILRMISFSHAHVSVDEMLHAPLANNKWKKHASLPVNVPGTYSVQVLKTPACVLVHRYCKLSMRKRKTIPESRVLRCLMFSCSSCVHVRIPLTGPFTRPCIRVSDVHITPWASR